MKFIVYLLLLFSTCIVADYSPKKTFLQSGSNLCDVCGVARVIPRMAGGSSSLYSPWTVYIRFRNALFEPLYYCSGVLLSYDWIITEGHCLRAVEEGGKNDFTALAGTVHLNQSSEHAQVGKLAEYFMHSNYSYVEGDVNSYHDVMLIRLKRPFKPSPYVMPICLFKRLPQSLDHMRSLYQGFGDVPQMSYGQKRVLREAWMSIVPHELCKQAYNHKNQKAIVMEEHLCAKGKTKTIRNGKEIEEEVGACSGDSGGPLSVIRQDRHWLLALASWGGPCDHFKGKPIVFTRISSYIKWITSMTGIEPC